MTTDQEDEKQQIETVSGDDPSPISATISLPAAVWERLTAHLRGDDHAASDDPDQPDIPLHERIETFLEMQVAEWESSVSDEASSDGSDDFRGDPVDGVPF